MPPRTCSLRSCRFSPFPNRDAIAIGYAGVYSTFLLPARKAGARFGVDPRDILIELGRRKAMAGQEDWVIDVAQDLASRTHSIQAAGVR